MRSDHLTMSILLHPVDFSCCFIRIFVVHRVFRVTTS